ncbi:MAG: Omp28-related outer membrane protein [Bacteroidetes bacterium]|nr:Omp28-related outer membrane protein [Bacteroidota bacterium]
MRKITLIILALGIIASACKKDESTTTNPVTTPPPAGFLAPTTVMKKAAVLEDFTGVRCGYCPDGHAIAKTLETTYPGKVVVMCVHTGSYAAPATGWANFTNTFGAAIAGQTGLTGYPAGTMNRRVFTGLGMTAGGTAMGRGNWTSAATQVMAEDAPVNIGAAATYNASTKVLTVKVDLYYTANETAANNINVAFLQNNLICQQSGGTPDPNNYAENNVLRHLVTGQWGELVPATSTKTGTKYTKTYTYTVPSDYNGATIPPGGGAVTIANCDVAVFVARGQGEVLNGIKVKVK